MADSDSESDVDSESDKKRNFSPIFYIGGEAKKNFFIHVSTRHPFLSPTCDFYMDGEIQLRPFAENLKQSVSVIDGGFMPLRCIFVFLGNVG